VNVVQTSAGESKLGGLMIGVGAVNFERPIMQITDEAEILVAYELYGRPAGGLRVGVDILSSLDAPPLANASPQPLATNVADKFMFIAKVPVSALKPGDYILRAQLQVGDGPVGTLTRTIRKK
jgi:hypothetical protein